MSNGTVAGFWQSFIDSLEVNHQPVPEKYEAWHFCNDPGSADALARLVLQGTKTATASLFWTYQAEGSPIPKPGDHCIITLWSGTPVCIIKITDVQIIPFNQVSPAFACDEGEGDRSLDYWRRVHLEFFTEECAVIGCTPEPSMPVVCEHFRVVYRQGEFDPF